MTAMLALQGAVFAALSAHAGLTALIGADRIFDDVPGDTRPPYIRFDAFSAADWNTATEEGEEHEFSLELWSAHDGRKQLGEIASAVREAIGGVSSVSGHALVNLEHLETRFARDPASDLFRCAMRFRAVTEPL